MLIDLHPLVCISQYPPDTTHIISMDDKFGECADIKS